jgi:hypothetical protein
LTAAFLGRARVPAVALACALCWTATALGAPYASGFYAGDTTQGKPISFAAAGTTLTDLYTEIVDGCHPGTYDDFLFPDSARIDAHGTWVHDAAGNPAQPTVYHGTLAAQAATGTIADVAKDRTGRICRGKTRFTAALVRPLSIGHATIGARGTDVPLTLRLPAGEDGRLVVPYTSAAVLVYASNAGCPAGYRSAARLARAVNAKGFTGLIADRSVDAGYAQRPYRSAPRSYRNGVFAFHVATDTILPGANRRSPFSSVCAMLYNGRPASRTPGRNVALQTAQVKLVSGRGIPAPPPAG